MLLLSTPVVFYCGWIFISGSYHSLRRRTLNMSVLIATGVLAAYLFSVLITFIGGGNLLLGAPLPSPLLLFLPLVGMRSPPGTHHPLPAPLPLPPPPAH